MNSALTLCTQVYKTTHAHNPERHSLHKSKRYYVNPCLSEMASFERTMSCSPKKSQCHAEQFSHGFPICWSNIEVIKSVPILLTVNYWNLTNMGPRHAQRHVFKYGGCVHSFQTLQSEAVPHICGTMLMAKEKKTFCVWAQTSSMLLANMGVFQTEIYFFFEWAVVQVVFSLFFQRVKKIREQIFQVRRFSGRKKVG